MSHFCALSTCQEEKRQPLITGKRSPLHLLQHTQPFANRKFANISSHTTTVLWSLFYLSDHTKHSHVKMMLTNTRRGIKKIALKLLHERMSCKLELQNVEEFLVEKVHFPKKSNSSIPPHTKVLEKSDQKQNCSGNNVIEGLSSQILIFSIRNSLG